LGEAGRGLVAASIVYLFPHDEDGGDISENVSSIFIVKHLVEIEGDRPFPSVPFPKGRGRIRINHSRVNYRSDR
jgi:hypothetical protein